MIKIKYNGIKIKTDSIDEAVAILESLKAQPPSIPLYLTDQGPNVWPYEPWDWSITCSGTATTGTRDVLTISGESLTVTSN